MHSLGYHSDICLLGLADCKVEYIKPRTPFKTTEYDGAGNLEVGYDNFTILK